MTRCVYLCSSCAVIFTKHISSLYQSWYCLSLRTIEFETSKRRRRYDARLGGPRGFCGKGRHLNKKHEMSTQVGPAIQAQPRMSNISTSDDCRIPVDYHFNSVMIQTHKPKHRMKTSQWVGNTLCLTQTGNSQLDCLDDMDGLLGHIHAPC